MFTGIVEAVGNIENVRRGREGVRLVVDAASLPLARVRVGDSVCVQGACLTVVARRGRRLEFHVSRETLDCTIGLDRPGPVNLERSLRLGDPLGGHLVTGHVDGIGEVVSFDDVGDSKRLRVRVPRALAKFVARKGSICVDGVSLTVNRVASSVLEMNLIPHTLEATTLSRLAAASKVNLEIDLVARYVDRILGASRRVRSTSAS